MHDEFANGCNANQSFVGDNSAINCLQCGAEDQFARLDDLIADLTDTMPEPLSVFLVTNFKVYQVKLDLINNLGYLSLSSYVSQGSCTICEIVALVGW